MTSAALEPTAALAPSQTGLGALRWSLARDLRVAVRTKGELGVQLMFYVIVVSLFPLAVAPDRPLLAALGPGVLWVAALFAGDFADGTLEQLVLSPYPLPALVSGKIAAHWLTTGLPIAVLAPLLGAQYGLEETPRYVLAAALLIGTPVLSLLGAIGAALTLGLRGSGSLLALLILPLYVPVLIFGAGAVEAVRGGLAATPHLSLLAACLLLALVGAPFAAAAAVRIALD
jgi:heme exporter protein B